jgi:hypothetical protein
MPPTATSILAVSMLKFQYAEQVDRKTRQPPWDTRNGDCGTQMLVHEDKYLAKGVKTVLLSLLFPKPRREYFQFPCCLSPNTKIAVTF